MPLPVMLRTFMMVLMLRTLLILQASWIFQVVTLSVSVLRSSLVLLFSWNSPRGLLSVSGRSITLCFGLDDCR